MDATTTQVHYFCATTLIILFLYQIVRTTYTIARKPALHHYKKILLGVNTFSAASNLALEILSK